jgi:DNA-binding LytR/AlgR family response regulator
MKILITDDEAPARARLRFMLDELGESDVIEASSVSDAIRQTADARVDVILLDIRMPLLDGFDLVSLLPEPKPAIIFVTAYDEHALKAFDVEAIDYLTKPVRKERLLHALGRVGGRSGKATKPRYLTRITTERANALHVLDVDSCAVFHAEDKLVYVRHQGAKYRVASALDELEAKLDPEAFFRPHRNCIVHLGHVASIRSDIGGWVILLKDGTEWDVARRRVAELKERLGLPTGR